VARSETARHLFAEAAHVPRVQRPVQHWLSLANVTCNNLHDVDVSFPIGALTTVTGVSGSGKSSLVSVALVQLVGDAIGADRDAAYGAPDFPRDDNGERLATEVSAARGEVTDGLPHIRRLVQVDQAPIGRTPRSNLATYTGLFDAVRRLFAATRAARAKRFDAGRFSFNVAKGRCPHCEGQGFVFVELLFLPGVYSRCPECHGARYNAATLAIRYEGRTIADVLAMTVDEAAAFFADQPPVSRPLRVLHDVGLGYLRLGQPATELSGGEAQRIKLARELQRVSRGTTLYVLDEPTTGLHPSDVDRLLTQLHALTDAGNTVVIVEHDMRVAADSDWVIDLGPGAGENGGQIVVAGAPSRVAASAASTTATYLRRAIH
jgi:excinuclease ABC subunit A